MVLSTRPRSWPSAREGMTRRDRESCKGCGIGDSIQQKWLEIGGKPMQSSNRQPTEQDEGDTSWPVVDGSYSIGDPTAPHSDLCAHQ